MNNPSHKIHLTPCEADIHFNEYIKSGRRDRISRSKKDVRYSFYTILNAHLLQITPDSCEWERPLWQITHDLCEWELPL